MSKFTSIMFAISLLAIVGWAGTVFAADPSTKSTTASVTIIDPIGILETTGLDFGNVIAPSTGTHTGNVQDTSGVFAITTGNGVFTSSASASGACSDTGLTLTVSSTGSGTDTLTVTGLLDVAAGTGAGGQTCPYTVTASYN